MQLRQIVRITNDFDLNEKNKNELAAKDTEHHQAFYSVAWANAKTKLKEWQNNPVKSITKARIAYETNTNKKHIMNIVYDI